MKKKLSLILTSVTLLIAMIVTLCACSSYGGVKRKFESEGWTENEELIEQQDKLLTAILGEDYKSACTIHALKKDGSALNYVVILEFNSTDKMEEKIESNETLKGIVKDVQNSDFINGNCVLVYYTLGGKGNEVFKSSK